MPQKFSEPGFLSGGIAWFPLEGFHVWQSGKQGDKLAGFRGISDMTRGFRSTFATLLVALFLFSAARAYALDDALDNAALAKLPADIPDRMTTKSGAITLLLVVPPMLNGDCTAPPEGPVIRVIQTPSQGSFFVRRADAQFPKSKCPGVKMPSLWLYYRSDAGFKGEDNVSIGIEQAKDKIIKFSFVIDVH
jgi:hypothetical protein